MIRTSPGTVPHGTRSFLTNNTLVGLGSFVSASAALLRIHALSR